MANQEPLSTSNEVSKIHLPNKELVGLKKPKEITKETTKLPKPTGWRILVLPFRMKEKTDAGPFNRIRNYRQTTSGITVRKRNGDGGRLLQG